MIFRDNDKDNWMRTMERKLFYVCRATDTIKDVPYTESRANSVSTLFYPTRREALVDLKSVIENRVQNGVCQIMEIEKELANAHISNDQTAL